MYIHILYTNKLYLSNLYTIYNQLYIQLYIQIPVVNEELLRNTSETKNHSAAENESQIDSQIAGRLSAMEDTIGNLADKFQRFEDFLTDRLVTI